MQVTTLIEDFMRELIETIGDKDEIDLLLELTNNKKLIAKIDLCFKDQNDIKQVDLEKLVNNKLLREVIESYLIEKDKIHVNDALANCAFFLYAMHALVIVDIGKILFVGLHLTDTPITMILLYFTILISTICICLLTYFLLKKFAPKICSLLTGGR